MPFGRHIRSKIASRLSLSKNVGNASSLNAPQPNMAGDNRRVDEEGVNRLLHAFKGDSCAFYGELVQLGKTTCQKGAIKTLGDGKWNSISKDTLFANASLSKIFLNVALFQLIEDEPGIGNKESREMVKKIRSKNPRKRNIMKNSWDTSAIKILNSLRSKDISLESFSASVYREPSILQLCTHIRAFNYSQRHLVGPNGSFIMSEDAFVKVFNHLTDTETSAPANEYEYSNWNAIIAALIIKEATELSLADAIKALVLTPLGMNNTVVDVAGYEEKKSMIAEPFIITKDGVSKDVLARQYLGDDLELAVGGGYTCIEDMAALLRCFMSEFTGKKQPPKDRFFEAKDVFEDEGNETASYLTGLCTDLDSKTASYESIEHALSGSQYTLGKRRDESVPVVMKAGTVRGYSCRYYMAPRAGLFVIVLTNSSGILDPSLHIGQDILQRMIGLDKHVDIASKAGEILAKQLNVVHTSTAGLLPHFDFTPEEMDNLKGVYTDHSALKQLTIRTSAINGLEVEIRDSLTANSKLKGTGAMRLVKISKDVLAVAPYSNEESLDLFVAWRDFALQVRRNGSIVQSLQEIFASSTKLMNNKPKDGYMGKYDRN